MKGFAENDCIILIKDIPVNYEETKLLKTGWEGAILLEPKGDSLYVEIFNDENQTVFLGTVDVNAVKLKEAEKDKLISERVFKYSVCAKHIITVNDLDIPIRLTENMCNTLTDIKIWEISNSIDNDKDCALLDLKEGIALYKERLILIREDNDIEVVYHEVGHFVSRKAKLCKYSEYHSTFLSEVTYMYEIDGRNRYVLNPIEYYAQAFALYCIRPKFFRTRCPRTYNLLIISGIIEGDVVVAPPKFKNNLDFILSKSTRNLITMSDAFTLVNTLTDMKLGDKLYKLLIGLDKRDIDKAYNKVAAFFSINGIVLPSRKEISRER